MRSFLDLVLGGIRVMLLIRATGCLFESLEYIFSDINLKRGDKNGWKESKLEG